VEDQLDLMQGAKYFSSLDLKNGFFHVYIDEQRRKVTAFIVPDGHYEFLRVPFGLCIHELFSKDLLIQFSEI
jgi:hypothetical protein